MVAVQSRLDDVLLALKNKKVEATHQVVRTIPTICTEDGKSRRITIDISAEGERELEKLDKKFRDTLVEAGQVYGRIGDVRIEARAAKGSRKAPAAAAEAPAEPVGDDAPAEDAVDAPDGDVQATESSYSQGSSSGTF